MRLWVSVRSRLNWVNWVNWVNFKGHFPLEELLER